MHRVTLLDHLVCYLGKAITVQVKVKGASGVAPSSVMMGTSVTPAPPAAWFMRGETTKKHATLVARLLSDMAEVYILFIVYILFMIDGLRGETTEKHTT